MNLKAIRNQFPLLQQRVNGKPLVYLDNAATTQKPRAVLKALDTYYRQQNANVHRGSHHLSDLATARFEDARRTVQGFLNARSEKEIIWTRGTTEGINLIAQSFARPRLQSGDEILLSELEHHANIVPWQMVAEQTGAVIRVIPIRENGDLDLNAFDSLMNEKTRILSLTHISNALGTINPVAGLIRKARQNGTVVVIDGAQAVSHLEVDVQRLDCDFYLFSGHKLFGPTGIGVLYGRQALLESMSPWQGGGEMIEKVSFSGTTYNQLPFKFEAGTPNIAGAIGLAEAIRFLQQQDRKALAAHERTLMQKAIGLCKDIPGFSRIGEPTAGTSILSFQLTSHHQQDVGLLLDQQGIAVRTGHHCAMPLMEKLGLPGTVRASFCFYNSEQDVERFAAALAEISQGGGFTAAPVVTADDIFSQSPFGREINADALREKLTGLSQWNDRYREIMQLGKQLPSLTSAMKTSANLVKGCESDAWLLCRKDSDGRLWFVADSDARIIRGLIALVLSAVNGKTGSEILNGDLQAYFDQLQLSRHLSPSRGNGLKAIVDEILRKAADQ